MTFRSLIFVLYSYLSAYYVYFPLPETLSNEIYYTGASMQISDCRPTKFLQVGHPFFHLIFGHHLLFFEQPEGHEDST